MEFLGYSEETPAINNKGNWEMLELNYDDEKSFCDATSKIFSAIKNESCRALISDQNNERYFVDILDVRYDSIGYQIKIWPHSCKNSKK